MRYDDFRRSDDIDDRRDNSGTGGGGFGIPMGGGGGLGIGTIIVLGLVGWRLVEALVLGRRSGVEASRS